MHIALTGTPAAGKTTLARLAEEKGWRVVSINAWAKQTGCIVGHDDEDGSDIIDVDVLAQHMPAGDEDVLFDGHLAHLLPVDVAWVVRCDPDILRGRLEARGYPPAKVLENMEAEAIDLILQEALDSVPRVVQRDGTRRSPEELFSAFVDLGSGSMKDHDIEPVDWSHRLPIR